MTIDQDRFDALFPASCETGRRCIIRAVDVRKIYRMGKVETHALRGVTVDIVEGDETALREMALPPTSSAPICIRSTNTTPIGI